MQNIVRSRGCADPGRCCNGGCASSRRVHRPLAVHWGAALPYGQLGRRTGSSTSHVLRFTVTWLVDDAAAQSCWRCIRGWLGEASELTQRSSFRRRKPAASSTWASISGALEYERGSLVTFDGSTWCANERTRDQQGKTGAWTIALSPSSLECRGTLWGSALPRGEGGVDPLGWTPPIGCPRGYLQTQDLQTQELPGLTQELPGSALRPCLNAAAMGA